MAVKDHVVLSSDGGSVTMGRRLAFYAYGRFDVVIPEGREQQVEDDRIQNGYIARNPGQHMGRFDFGFIRQDATINLEAQTSDLELAIDSTEKRSEGDVYVERDISRAGMNGFELGRDFGLDDIVRYRVWGNYLRLPVTAGDLESSVDGGLRGVRVHVGGQVASDSEARLRRNDEILGQIENEKRQRLRQVNAESRARTAAISAETSNRKAAIASESRRSDAYADSVASGVESRLSADFEASYERYSEALSELGDEWRRELQDGLSAEQQARVEALRLEQQAREKAGTDLRGKLEKKLNDAVAAEREARALGDSNEARARQKAISDLSQSFSTELEVYGRLIDEAGNSTDEATKKVVAFWSEENQNLFNQSASLTLAALSAYNDVNNIKWVSQDAWNEQQQKINDAAAKFQAQQLEINAQNEAFRKLTEELDAQQTEQIVQLIAMQKQIAGESQGRIREIMATPAGTSDPRIPVEKRNDGEPGWQITLTDMVGGSVFNVQWHASTGTAPSGATEIKQTYSIVRTLDSNSSSYNLTSTPNHAFVFARWAAASKRQVTVDKSVGSRDISRGIFQNIMNYPAPTKTARQATLRLKVTWAAATYDDNYGIRIRAGDRILKTYNKTQLGPLTFLGNGEQWMSITVSNATINSGETISVDAYSNALTSGSRRMKSAELTGTWIEEV